MAIDRRLLGIYLNDHLAGSTAGLDLARRARNANRDTELGDFLEQLATEIGEDRATLEEVMSRFGIGKDRIKVTAAWAMEKVGRAKLNGQIRGYSPLSRLVELEALSLGVEGKRLLWKALREVAADEPVLKGIDLDALIDRARRQRRGIERRRLKAAETALGVLVSHD